ncbi:unnamed protein product [Bursaphelenchus xylophilus]|uniref:(pine wood nematode) hypothetical protein n=1 Tax=Bursaphelenchus xylophilus TaxID=6326 RepID=A0A811M227_BURXY|nr:unnamed protein product [Bursaphelenchus xylophilus]CAG9126272.1 unnamed protein product [Bursaphelenchus xylophilus]
MPRSPRTDFRSNFRGISVHSIRIEGNRGPNSGLDNYFINNDKDQDVLVLSIRYGPSGMRQIGDVSWSNLKRMECGKIDASTSRLEKSLKAELSITPGAEGHMLETT